MEALGSMPALCGLNGGCSGQTNNVGIAHINLIYQDCTIIIKIIVNSSDDDQVLLCSDVMDYCRKVSPLEDSKNRDSLLKKLVRVCVCVCVGECMSVCSR